MPPPSNAAGSTFRLGGTLTIPSTGLGAMQLPGRCNGAAVDHATAVAVARRCTPRPGRWSASQAPQQFPPVEQNLRELGVDVLDLVYLRVGRLSAMGADPIGERFAALATCATNS
jgi:pyridoxine 4-dehydrogenase